MKKNVAGQAIGAQMITIADGSNFTGTVTVYITGDNGTQTIGSVGSGVCTHEGNGYHSYAPAQAETNYNHIAWTFVGTGAITASPQVYTTFPQTGDAFDRIGVAGAGLTNINLPNQTMDITGNVSGSVGSVTAAVTLPTIPANWITAAGINASAMDGKGDWNVGKTGYSLAVDQSGVTIGTVGTLTGHTAQTGDSFARLGVAGAGLTDLGGMSTGMKAEILVEVLKSVTTQMTEAYAAVGVVPSPAELMFEVRALLAEMAKSGTVLTTKRIDGSTTAATYAYDDADAPTSITRT